MSSNLPTRRFIYKNDKPVKPMAKSQKVFRDKVILKIKNKEFHLEEVSACICGNTSFNLFSERERYGLPVKTVICNSCGILFQNPRLEHDSLIDFYKNYFRDFYMPDSSPEALFRNQINIGNKTLNYLSRANGKLPAKAKVLDGGCGPGGALQPFKDQGYECTGCDYTDRQVLYGRDRGLNVYLGGIEELTQKYSNYFDFVMLNDVLEHLPDPRVILNNIHKVLKTDGILYVRFPGTRNLATSNYPDILRLFQLAHTYYFDLKQLEYLLLMSDFELITGDESLQAIFRKGDKERLKTRKEVLKNELQEYYMEIQEYILQCEKKRLFLYFKNNMGLLFKHPKAFLGQTLFFLRHSIFN